jgi:hypothetical protein
VILITQRTTADHSALFLSALQFKRLARKGADTYLAVLKDVASVQSQDVAVDVTPLLDMKYSDVLGGLPDEMLLHVTILGLIFRPGSAPPNCGIIRMSADELVSRTQEATCKVA